jgi:hypothetical protein
MGPQNETNDYDKRYIKYNDHITLHTCPIRETPFIRRRRRTPSNYKFEN